MKGETGLSSVRPARRSRTLMHAASAKPVHALVACWCSGRTWSPASALTLAGGGAVTDGM